MNEDAEDTRYFYNSRDNQNKTETTRKPTISNETVPKITTPSGATDPPATPPSNSPTGHNENDHSEDSLDDHVEETPPTTEQSETEADLSVTKEKIEVKIFV